MADDPAAEAIGIIGALREAGLLETAVPSATEPARIVGALREAGLLATAPVTPEPPPGPAVGDEIPVWYIRGVSKVIDERESATAKARVRFTHNPVLERTVTYDLDFPPNDEKWLPEIDKVIAAPKPGLYVGAFIEITDVLTTDMYRGKLTYLSVSSWWAVYH